VRWEVATAFSGAVFQIDPFDQPNVEEAKTNTRVVIGPSRTAEAPRRVERSRESPTRPPSRAR